MIKEEGKVRAMKRGIGAYISAILIILNGVICIVNHQQIYKWIPSLCGAILLIKGIIMLIEGIRAKDYATLEGEKFERAIVIIAIGIGIIIRQSDALFIVGVFWGLEGLNKATNYLNEGLYYFTRKEKFIFPMSKAIIEFVLSSILIFDPFSKIAEHIVILGLELVLEGVSEFVNIYKGKEELLA